MYPVKLTGIIIDKYKKFEMLLQIKNSNRGLKVPIDVKEAEILAFILFKIKNKKRTTFDMISELANNFEMKFEKGIIKIEDDKLASYIYFDSKNGKSSVKTTIYEAIIFGVKFKFSIFATEEVLNDFSIDIKKYKKNVDVSNEETPDEESLKNFIENFDIDKLKKHFSKKGNSEN